MPRPSQTTKTVGLVYGDEVDLATGSTLIGKGDISVRLRDGDISCLYQIVLGKFITDYQNVKFGTRSNTPWCPALKIGPELRHW